MLKRDDEGPEMELVDNYADDLEYEITQLLESVLGEGVNASDISKEIGTIKDAIVSIGERHFGIPEMFTYPYTICEETPVVLWSQTESFECGDGPMWWSNSDGWTSDLSAATRFSGKELLTVFMPIGFTCGVPLRDAQELLKKMEAANAQA